MHVERGGHDLAPIVGELIRAGIGRKREFSALCKQVFAFNDADQRGIKGLAVVMLSCGIHPEPPKPPKPTRKRKSAVVRANQPKIFPQGEPPDRNFVEFVYHLNNKRGSGSSDNEIARAYTKETLPNDGEAKKLMARYRKARSARKVDI